MTTATSDHVAGDADIPVRWIVTSLIIIILYICILIVKVAQAPNDFAQHFIGARNLLQTGDPYSRKGEELALGRDSQNCYPPLISYLCLPLAFVSLSTATYLWLGVNLVLTGVLAWQLLAVLRPDGGWGWRSLDPCAWPTDVLSAPGHRHLHWPGSWPGLGLDLWGLPLCSIECGGTGRHPAGLCRTGQAVPRVPDPGFSRRAPPWRGPRRRRGRCELPRPHITRTH